MHAYRICFNRNLFSGNRCYGSFLYHLDDTCHSFFFIGDHCARFASCYQRAVFFICSVRKYFFCHAKSYCLCGSHHFAATRCKKDKLRIDFFDCFCDCCCQFFIFSCHVIHCTVRFYMLQFDSLCCAECFQCPDLILHHCFYFCRRCCQISSAESDQIRISRMCANTDALLFRKCYGLCHYHRIGCMKSTCYICGRNKGNDFLIQSAFIISKTFSKITV